MSEKRFIVENDNNEVSIKDNVKDNYPFALAYEHIDDADNLIQECLSLVGLLNEQQSTINKLNDELELTSNIKLYSRRELERKVDEQQAIINELKERNAHNFAKNIQLKKEIKELKEENEQLQQQLQKLPPKIKEVWLDE